MSPILVFVLAVAAPVVAEPQAPLPELLLEARTAGQLELEVGDTVWIASISAAEERRFRVAGLYRRPADPARATLRDYRAILHLPDLQDLTGAPDRVDRFSLRLRPGADRESVIAEIERLAYGADAYPTEWVADASSQTFRVVSRFHGALAVITVTGSAIFLLCLVVLKVEERHAEGAAMREIGISRRTLFLWTFGETLAMAILGTIVGLAGGWAGSGLINLYFRRVYDTSLAFARVTPNLALRVTAIALATGIVIGLWAGWRMVRAAPSRLREP